MHVDVEEIRVHLLAMKSVQGATDVEIMLCRWGVPLIKAEEFLIFNRLKLLVMARCNPVCFSLHSKKLIAVIDINSMIIFKFTEPQGRKYRKLVIRSFISRKLEGHLSRRRKIISTKGSVRNLSGGLLLRGSTIFCRLATLCAVLWI